MLVEQFLYTQGTTQARVADWYLKLHIFILAISPTWGWPQWLTLLLAKVLDRAQLLVVPVLVRFCSKYFSDWLLRAWGQEFSGPEMYEVVFSTFGLNTIMAWSAIMHFSSDEFCDCIWEYLFLAWSKIWVIATIVMFLRRRLGYNSHCLMFFLGVVLAVMLSISNLEVFMSIFFL